MVAGADEIGINEIHFDPENEQGAEFIELYNRGSLPVELEGWRFTGGVSFTFPAITLAAKEYLVTAEDPVSVLAEFGVTALGPRTGKLSHRFPVADRLPGRRFIDGTHSPLPRQ